MKCPLTQRPNSQYRGRFAPSPSGDLHFGSLIAALASFLDARYNQGLWFVRIEDIDPPREVLGAKENILATLLSYGLKWDEDVLYQSAQAGLYRQVLRYLEQQQLSYYCRCTRAEIKKSGGIYPGTCSDLHLKANNNAIRLKNNRPISHYFDLIQGEIKCDEALAQEDFILLRKDGLFAYQLAVVVDDIYQGITHIVRGCDLIEPTARQLGFYQLLGFTSPQFSHVPLAVSEQGFKLSKQNKAPAIDKKNPQPALIAALHYLGQKPPQILHTAPVNQIISWAIAHWDINAIPKKQEIVL